MYVLCAPEIPILAGPAQTSVFFAEGAKNATARVRAHWYVALPLDRQPKAISVISGGGLSAPVFT